jgi:hypothetical protein
MLGCKVALEQDLSIGAIFRRKNYLYEHLILSTGHNGMYLSLILLDNWVTRLSRPFSGSGDFPSRNYDENRFAINTAGDLRPAGDPSHFEQASYSRGGPAGSGFRHKIFEKSSPVPKNGIERRVSRFSTICAKNVYSKYSY